MSEDRDRELAETVEATLRINLIRGLMDIDAPITRLMFESGFDSNAAEQSIRTQVPIIVNGIIEREIVAAKEREQRSRAPQRASGV